MTAVLSPQPIFQAFAPNGQFLVGGQLFTYAAGTSTPQATYTDSTQVTPNTNPVILNAMGQAPVWIDPTLAYKFVLQDAANNPIWTADNITSNTLPNFIVGPPPINTTALTVNGLASAPVATGINVSGGSGSGFAVVNLTQTSGTGAALNIILNAGASVAYNINNGIFSSSYQLTTAGTASLIAFGAGSSLHFGAGVAPNAMQIGATGAVIIAAPPGGSVALIVAPGLTNGELIAANPSLTNAAGALTATLTNAPLAGNPTKWIRINDNGTIRAIPTW